MYLTGIVDWYSKFVLSWRFSTTLDTRFCVETLQEVLEKYGAPEIFNTDHECYFTSAEFTGVLESHEIAISMDGKGRALDNSLIAITTGESTNHLMETIQQKYILGKS